MKNKLILVLLIIFSVLIISCTKKPGIPLDDFAKCLTEKNVKFYGAYWCSHCQNQKKLFGDSIKYVNYIECASPNSQSQLQVCKDANIQAYPTWVFLDGTRQSGEVSLETLSSKSGCELPKS